MQRKKGLRPQLAASRYPPPPHPPSPHPLLTSNTFLRLESIGKVGRAARGSVFIIFNIWISQQRSTTAQLCIQKSEKILMEEIGITCQTNRQFFWIHYALSTTPLHIYADHPLLSHFLLLWWWEGSFLGRKGEVAVWQPPVWLTWHRPPPSRSSNTSSRHICSTFKGISQASVAKKYLNFNELWYIVQCTPNVV